MQSSNFYSEKFQLFIRSKISFCMRSRLCTCLSKLGNTKLNSSNSFSLFNHHGIMIHYWVIVVSSDEQLRKVDLHDPWYCCSLVHQTQVYPSLLYCFFICLCGLCGQYLARSRNF